MLCFEALAKKISISKIPSVKAILFCVCVFQLLLTFEDVTFLELCIGAAASHRP